MGLLSRESVVQIVEQAVTKRQVLSVTYVHTTDGETVVHTIAPFDIGSTNPATRERFKDNLYAYSFTHRDDATQLPDPKVCTFSVESFASMSPTGCRFDESDLAVKNWRRTGYDYRRCGFALLPNRDWFR
jgi:hypothetical protein